MSRDKLFDRLFPDAAAPKGPLSGRAIEYVEAKNLEAASFEPLSPENAAHRNDRLRVKAYMKAYGEFVALARDFFERKREHFREQAEHEDYRILVALDELKRAEREASKP